MKKRIYAATPLPKEAQTPVAMVTISLEPNGTYKAFVTSAGDLNPAEVSALGVRTEAFGDTGWEALQQMAENWKNTRFLEGQGSSM